MHHKLRMAQVLGLIVAGVLAAPAAAKEKAEDASLREQLKAQYRLARLSGVSLDTAEGGTVLTIEKPGILGSSRLLGLATKYSDGVLHAPGKFELALNDANIESVGQEPIDKRPLPVGVKVYVYRIEASVKREWIQFNIVECNACNGVTEGSPYESTVEFHFPKGYLESASLSQVEDAISQVFATEGGTQQAQTGQAGQMPGQGQAPAGPGLTNDDIVKMAQAKLGNSLVIPTPPLKFPSTYVSAQAQGDRLQLNADHSFSLQEAGQSYHGTFIVNGNTLEFSITETNTKSTATIQGNSLIDGSGQTWVLQGQSAGIAPGGTVLQNMDVGGNPPTPPIPPGAAPVVSCADYQSCFEGGRAALTSSQWDSSLADFQKASSLEPSKPDPWAELGKVYLAAGQYDLASAMWDKALSLGGTLSFQVWHYASTHYEKGTFHLSAKEISFVVAGNEGVFSVGTTEASSVKSHHPPLMRDAWSFGMKVGGRYYWFSSVPFGVDCKHPGRCSDPAGYAQEGAVANYVAQTIGRLAPGSLGK